MARVLRLWQHSRILAPRRMPPARRRLLAQRLVRPLVIVGGAKRFELSLLARAGRRGRSGCLRLQRPVHALMGAVLLRMARLGPYRANPQADPPHAQRRQPVQARGLERGAIVGLDGGWQAHMEEQSIEERAG